MPTPNEARETAIRLAIEKLNEATDILTPHCANDALVHGVAEVAGASALILSAQFEMTVARGSSTPENAAGHAIVQLLDGIGVGRAAAVEPPFDASAFERPEHHISCLCADCNAARMASVRG